MITQEVNDVIDQTKHSRADIGGQAVTNRVKMLKAT